MLVSKKYFSIQEYHRLFELGFFTEDERIELIRGDIIQMVAKGTRHVVCCTRLIKHLTNLLAEGAVLRCQDPISLSSNSEPEPDFAILKKRKDDYLNSHPTPKDIILIIEVADSSLTYDQTVKLPLYAESGIEHYWIFNLIDNQLETYSQPYRKASDKFDYLQKIIFLSNGTVSLPELSNTLLDLSQIFPN
jgi:Uma2 family endonuclease